MAFIGLFFIFMLLFAALLAVVAIVCRMDKSNHMFRILLFLFQLVCTVSFIAFIFLDNQVWAADYSLLVAEESRVYSLWNSMYSWVLLPGLLTLLAFIPTVIIDIAGFIFFFTKRKDASYLVLVICSTILECFQIILGICVLGMRQG